MTRFDVAVLAFRILALYFLFEALRGLAQLLVILTGNWTEPVPALAWSVELALLAALGVLLFLLAPRIARGLFKGDEPMSTANRPEIGALALEVCGILLFAGSIAHWNQVLGSEGHWTWILPGAIGAALFLGATPFARRLFGAPLKPLAAPLHAHLQAVTFSVLGIWLLVSSLSALSGSVSERVLLDGWSRTVWAQAATALLGLVLFLGGAGLSAFWYWVRHAGLGARTDHSG
jgi:hypothetical protein